MTEKKLFLRFNGGLGNQLFQYSFAAYLNGILNRELVCDDFLLRIYRPGVTKRRLEVTYFIDEIERSSLIKSLFLMLICYRRVNYLVKTFQSYFGITKIIVIDDNDALCQPAFLDKYDIIVINGFFQSKNFAKYLDKSKINKLKSNFLNSRINNSHIQRVLNNNSVALHIRRSDYITNGSAAKFHGVCAPDYYDRAIEIFANDDRYVFNIFTDDVQWAAEHFGNRSKFVIISGANSLTSSEELLMMSMNSNFIIANSSYSWWAAYLSNNESKLVVIPKLWHAANPSFTMSAPENWIML